VRDNALDAAAPELLQTCAWRAANSAWKEFVSKRATSPYSDGKRNDDWQKVKFAKSETFTIGGWRETAGYMHTVLAGEWRKGSCIMSAGHARAATSAICASGYWQSQSTRSLSSVRTGQHWKAESGGPSRSYCVR
jgi:ATP-dependent DNA ligase